MSHSVRTLTFYKKTPTICHSGRQGQHSRGRHGGQLLGELTVVLVLGFGGCSSPAMHTHFPASPHQV